MSWRNRSFGGCLVVTDLLTVVWTKVIDLLFFKGFSPTTLVTDLLPLLTSPCLWPSPTFSGCGHRNDGIGSWQKSRMEMQGWERTMSDRSATTKTNAFSTQDKPYSGEQLLLTVLPTLLVVVNCESMAPFAALATMPDRGARVEARLIFGIAFFFIISFLTPRPKSISRSAHKINVTNLNSCWFLWTSQVLQREVGLSISTEEKGCRGLRNGRNAHMFFVCDTAADGNRFITQQDRFMLPLHPSLRCFPYLWLAVVC